MSAHELPGVGQNLQDHVDFILGFRSKDTDNFGLGLKAGLNLIRHARQWRRDGRSMLSTPFAEGGAFLKTDQRLERPDIQLHFLIAMLRDHGRKLVRGHGFSCHVCVLRPQSRGAVGLVSADPLAAPMIDPRFLSDERDLQTLIKGAKVTREILMAPALAPYRDEELWGTQDGMPDAQWERHIRKRADSIYHPVGTCKMGVDELAVVDSALRVHGMDSLRVVDASVMPTIIGGNTNAATIMIAEKAAELVRNGQPGRDVS